MTDCDIFHVIFFLLSCIKYLLNATFVTTLSFQISVLESLDKGKFCQFCVLDQHTQDQNLTYWCALRGLSIYNLFNLLSLSISVAFIFEWHSNLVKIPVCVTFQFEWHSIFEWYSNFSDNPILVTFKFERHSNLSNILIWVTFLFEWHSNLSEISNWVTFHF